MKVYQPIKDSMSGSGPMPFVFTEKRAAELWAEDAREEWTQYKVIPVDLREFNHDEGAVGSQLVQIRRMSAVDLLRARALKKWTAEECAALGIYATAPSTEDKP